MSGTMGIGFQRSSVDIMMKPGQGKSDRAIQVIRVAIYAEVGCPLFVLFDQIGCMNRVSRFSSVVTLQISFPPD